MTTIYPNGCGHYAIETPDGPVLQPNTIIDLPLAGRIVSGAVKWSSQGDYVEFSDRSICGLYPAMRLTIANDRRKLRKFRERWDEVRWSLLLDRACQLGLNRPDRSLRSIGSQVAKENGWHAGCTCARLYRFRNELERRLQLARRRLPMTLAPGEYPWLVEIWSQRMTVVWMLNYSRACFPLIPGQLCFYNGGLYRVGRVGRSFFSAIELSPAIQLDLDRDPQGASRV